jgi:hypothetical protein
MMTTRSFEWVDRRALAAIRFVDAVTGAPADGRVTLAAAGLSIVRKRSGDIVVLAAPGLEEHRVSFTAPPATPALGSVSTAIDARPTSPAYAARRFALQLPRDPDPAHRGNPDSLFNAARVELLPSPAYPPSGQAAALRVCVRRADDERRIASALVRLRPSAGLSSTRALTDAAGEALLVVRGVPMASPGPGATTVGDIAADVDVLVDPTLARFVRDDAIDVARAQELAQATGFIDPDDVETRLAATAPAAVAVRIASAATGSLTLHWSPP